MALPSFPERDLRLLSILFVLKLHEKLDEYERFQRIQDTDAYREELAEEHPDMARAFEKETVESREIGEHDLAIAEATADVAMYAATQYSFEP